MSIYFIIFPANFSFRCAPWTHIPFHMMCVMCTHNKHSQYIKRVERKISFSCWIKLCSSFTLYLVRLACSEVEKAEKLKSNKSFEKVNVENAYCCEGKLVNYEKKENNELRWRYGKIVCVYLFRILYSSSSFIYTIYVLSFALLEK